MPKIKYQHKRFREDALAIIKKANEIIEVYAAAGYDLTLRQLYYQFVSRDLLPNTIESYKKLGSIVNDARLAGLIDWDCITDRTRNLHKLADWSSPSEIIQACARSFRIDKWERQPCRIEVWIEKEALAGVFERVCDELQVPFLSCRGYTSQSEMWAAGRRLQQIVGNGQDAYILHFGDHDPSGIDMTRDIQERLELFMGGVPIKRLALNMDQVNIYSPPPNPAKATDSRFKVYMEEFGDESWELDALEPDVLAQMVRDAVMELRDEELWEEALSEEEEHVRLLSKVSETWYKIIKKL